MFFTTCNVTTWVILSTTALNVSPLPPVLFTGSSSVPKHSSYANAYNSIKLYSFPIKNKLQNWWNGGYFHWLVLHWKSPLAEGSWPPESAPEYSNIPPVIKTLSIALPRANYLSQYKPNNRHNKSHFHAPRRFPKNTPSLFTLHRNSGESRTSHLFIFLENGKRRWQIIILIKVSQLTSWYNSASIRT